MANKAIFSYGNGGKRKIGHSKFDMGHEHIMSSNFGGLHPAACFETLPDDYWDISDNTVTLLKPLTAPAFTRINQNFYGAYVRNQQIWKYWNDYISNGTAFGDVYGNNVTNQSLQNAWDVPSIPTPYLQQILKVGCGNATPVFHSYVFWRDDDSDGDILARMIVKNCTLNNVGTNPFRVTDLVQLLFQVDPQNSSLVLPEYFDLARKVDFQNYSYDVWVVHDNSAYRFLFSFYCSLRQWLVIRNLFSLGSGVVSNIPQSTHIGEDITDSYSYSSPSSSSQLFRFFADRISPEPKDSTSAFVVEKSDYENEKGEFLKSLDYYARIIDTNVEFLATFSHPSLKTALFQCIQSPYWGFRYVALYDANNGYISNADVSLPSFNPLTSTFWQVDALSLFGLSTLESFQSFFESVSQNIHYLGVSQSVFNYGLDMFFINSTVQTPLMVDYDPNSSSGLLYFSNSFGSSSSFSFSSSNKFRLYSSCDFSFLFDTSGLSVSRFSPECSFVSRDSLALGYDSMSMFVYLCRQSSILMDDFGLKIDPLSQRPFDNYRFELTNALPFFAYSKIWHDNFRNSVVSSPELDYSESNGVIYGSFNFYNSFVFANSYSIFFLEPAQRPSRYVGKVATDFKPNGWTLELTTFPRNSQGSAIHTHLPVNNYSIALALLTGHNFDYVFCSSLSNTDLNVFDYYMPSYYNGLLHLKYQNFNKDYFTSALLDPMSGANQVALGSTINELRQAEAEQHWWERTAMYRSIKSWFQGTYGITPVELPDDSRITGSDHIDVSIGEVIQTSGSTPESPQGTRSGLGGCRGSGSLCHGHANEHGWILILVSHTIESQYTQVYDKMWDVKESFLDYPTIDFASIGNESILQKELNYSTVPTSFFDFNYDLLSSVTPNTLMYLPSIASSSVRYKGKTNPIRKTTQIAGKYNIASGSGTSLDNIFGFIPRYSSYKFKFDQVSGQFRHELNFWHTFKRYLTSPILCHEFVNWEMAADDDDINRIFAVSDDFLDDKFAIDCFINASVDRALPFVCVPMTK